MNKEQFLCYFKKKENTFENNEDLITNVVTSSTKEATNVELRFSVDKINKSDSHSKTCQKQISENMKVESMKEKVESMR